MRSQSRTDKPRIARRSRGFASRLLIGLASACCLMLYQNCGTDFVPYDGSDLASLGIFGCGSSLSEAFSKSYHPFMRTNCASCHSPTQAPRFAQADVGLAYAEFLKTDQQTVREYALNPNHGAGAGGPKNAAAIDAAELNYNSCKGGSGGGPAGVTARTMPFILNANTTLQLRSINDIGNRLELGSTNLGGATLHFQIRADSVAGMPVYYIGRPSLQTGSATVAVKRIGIRINGQPITTATTFQSVDRVINPNTNPLNGQTPNGNLSTATSIVEFPGADPTTDTIQFEFDLLNAQ